MGYRFPNVGRQREAQHRAALFAALPGDVLTRRATLIVRCRGGALLCRVFRIGEAMLFVPVGKIRRNRLVRDGRGNGHAEPTWGTPDPYWLDPDVADEIRVRCHCHADTQIIGTADMLDHIRRGRRTMTMRRCDSVSAAH